MSKAMLKTDPNRQNPVDLNADYSSLTLLPPIRSDEPLVRDYLKHFFREMDSPKPFEPYVNDTYLKHLFAETKIELGLGETSRWAADLPPELYAQIKDRVDIDFAAMRVGPAEVMLHADHTHEEHPWHAALTSGAPRGIGAQLRVLGMDPDALEARARAHGAVVAVATEEKGHGWREVCVRDPDGYEWAVGVLCGPALGPA